MSQFVRQVPAKRSIFVSYSHDDHQACDTLLDYLKPACRRSGDTPIWVDKKDIQGGDRWRQRIEDGLAHSNVFIVLLSQKYVSSTFCMDDELGPILRKVARGDAIVIPVALHEVALENVFVDDGTGGKLSLGEQQCLPQGLYKSGAGERWGLVPLSKWIGDPRDGWTAVLQQIESAIHSSKRQTLPRVASDRAPALAQTPPETAPASPATSPSPRRLGLPYLCDREMQSTRLVKAAKDWEASRCRRPLVIVTEAVRDDQPEMWTQRMGTHELAQALEILDREGLSFGDPQPFRWPPPDVLDADEARNHLLRVWSQVLGGRARIPDPQ